MKRIFLDTNFIIDYLLRDEYKKSCTHFLSEGKKRGYVFYISYLTIANFAYVARKLPFSSLQEYLKILISIFEIIPNNKEQIQKSLIINSLDFEDSLQYSSAIEANCDCIITRNVKDFGFSEIEVISASDYVTKYWGQETK